MKIEGEAQKRRKIIEPQDKNLPHKPERRIATEMGRIVASVVGGTGMWIFGALIGFILGMIIRDNYLSRTVEISMSIGLTLGNAIGVYRIGNIGKQKWSFVQWSFLSTFAGVFWLSFSVFMLIQFVGLVWSFLFFLPSVRRLDFIWHVNINHLQHLENER